MWLAHFWLHLKILIKRELFLFFEVQLFTQFVLATIVVNIIILYILILCIIFDTNKTTVG